MNSSRSADRAAHPVIPSTAPALGATLSLESGWHDDPGADGDRPCTVVACEYSACSVATGSMRPSAGRNQAWAACTAGRTEQDEASREQRPIRRELVERIRREIAAGTYETPDKWEAALGRLFRFLEME